MVKICPNSYPEDHDAAYADYFANFPYALSPFQKWSIEAIVEGHHALVAAHTGSGKTVAAEFAIIHFCTQTNKKVIYASPIKALSNQKYYDFCAHELFNGISIGLVTGDIKTNPDASVIIMTTEILLNKLLGITPPHEGGIDINNVACVVFDEVHYINEKERGGVWEQAIMLLPPHIQMVMLSATLEAPETFAAWCEAKATNEKEVYLTTTAERVVPLTHYSFITCTTGIYKMYGKDKEIESRIVAAIDRLHVIQTPQGEFQEATVDKLKKTLRLFDVKNYRPSRPHVLNQLCKYMVANDMFPAICFAYSRKTVEDMAHEVETVLLEDDSKVRYVVHTECEQILRRSLPNWAEYVALPEYRGLLALLEKGVAIHHAGLLTVFREMVELMFARGYVKLLFCTETFACGLNMPCKTVVFSGLAKFDGSDMRPLLPHEYNQQSGRAGRRGKDTVGHVIHLTNLWDTDKYTNEELRHMLRGQPQRLESKFHISPQLILNLISRGGDVAQFTQKTMYQQVIDRQLSALQRQIDEKEAAVIGCSCGAAPPALQQVVALEAKLEYANNRTRKDIQRQLTALRAANPTLDRDLPAYRAHLARKAELATLKAEHAATAGCVQIQIDRTLAILARRGFIEGAPTLLLKGAIACAMREVHCIAFCEWFMSPSRDGHVHRMVGWSVADMVGCFSMFTNVTVSDDARTYTLPQTTDYYRALAAYEAVLDDVAAEELREGLQTGMDRSFQYDLVEATRAWCDADCEAACRVVLSGLEIHKGIYIGEFVKAVLKICNIAAEMESVAEYLGDMELLEKLKKIPSMMQKYVCSSQSLYL